MSSLFSNFFRFLFVVVIGVVVIQLMGCAAERQYENYTMTLSDINSLNVNNHPHGFGRSYCFSCHLPQNIHQVNNLNSPNFYLARQMVDASGLNSCTGCHGANGVP